MRFHCIHSFSYATVFGLSKIFIITAALPIPLVSMKNYVFLEPREKGGGYKG